jgi:hypothetical protein
MLSFQNGQRAHVNALRQRSKQAPGVAQSISAFTYNRLKIGFDVYKNINSRA